MSQLTDKTAAGAPGRSLLRSSSAAARLAAALLIAAMPFVGASASRAAVAQGAAQGVAHVTGRAQAEAHVTGEARVTGPLHGAADAQDRPPAEGLARGKLSLGQLRPLELPELQAPERQRPEMAAAKVQTAAVQAAEVQAAEVQAAQVQAAQVQLSPVGSPEVRSPDMPPSREQATEALASEAPTERTQEPAAERSARGRIAPEGASGREEKALAIAKDYMVSAANPLAVEAGLEILAAGGSAVDTAVAVQLVLNLVEPQSSGIGGGAFLVHFQAADGSIVTYDGRETAPAAAEPDRFLVDGRPMRFPRAVNSGLSIGVPGTLAMLEMAHAAHGRLPWARLFEPAIRLAEEGFAVSARLNLLLTWFGAERFTPRARAYFFDAGGSPRPVGYRLANPEFAQTLREIAAGGARVFYEGERIPQEIVAAVSGAPNAAGDMTLADIAGYRAIARPPVCVPYRKRQVCGMGPPSSGAIAVGQTLRLLEPFDLGGGGTAAMRPQAMHLIAEAQKLAYADRDLYVADPAFVRVPAGLLAESYLDERRQLIDPARAMAPPPAGVPPAIGTLPPGADGTVERPGTSHVSIVDASGNAVSLTTTLEGGFGSGVWAAGFLLNNELTDFSFRPVDAQGRLIANRVEGGKRPRSSMAPTIVLGPDGRLEAVLGSVGGARIILYVVKSLVALIDWEMNAQQAAALVNFGSRGKAFEIELGTETIWQALKVKPFGHSIAPDLMTSGTHIIVRREGFLEGGADPRREGVARGR